MPLKGNFTPNVAVPSGAIFPNGVEYDPAKPEVQATVRPEGSMFRSSPGYETVRPGRHRLSASHPHGPGIHFTPTVMAENLAEQGDPLMVDVSDKSGDYADVAAIPGSENLDENGSLSPEDAAQNKGVKLSEGNRSPSAGADVRESEKTVPDMGDRTPGRPLTATFWKTALVNPVSVFKDEYQQKPLVAIGMAGVFIGLAYALGTEFDRSLSRRRGRGVTGTVGAAPAAAVETTGHEVRNATGVVNTAITEAGKAAETAVSAAGDAVEAAGKAAEKVTETAADAAS